MSAKLRLLNNLIGIYEGDICQFRLPGDARRAARAARRLAERYFKDDPNTSLIKLRQFGEVLAQLTAAKSGLFASPEEQQADLLRRLKFERIVPRVVGDLFYQLRIAGNRATHAHTGDHAEALSTLKIARELGIWFHRTFADKKFSAGAFVPPPDPAAATKALQEELERLRHALDETRSGAEKARLAAESEVRERLSAEERARKEREERTVWEQLASEAENAKAQLFARATGASGGRRAGAGTDDGRHRCQGGRRRR